MPITAVPVGDIYVAPTGGVISGGRFRWPAWRRAIAKNTWGEIPSTILNSINPGSNPALNPNYPSRAPWALTDVGTANFASLDGVTNPWCGGAWDEAKGVFWLPLGGGHGDYGGNEAYKIRLVDEAPVWSSPRPPSGALPFIANGLPEGSTPQGNSYLIDDKKEATGVYADGRPRATHSYRKHVYVPGRGIVMAFHGGMYTSTYTSPKHCWLMDETTGEWDWKSTAVVDNASLGYPATCYDSLRDCVYLFGGGLVRGQRLNLTTWTYSIFADYLNTSGDASALYLAEYDLILFISNFFSQKIRVIEPGSGVISTPTMVGDAFASISVSQVVEWIPGIGLLCQSSDVLKIIRPVGNPRTDGWEMVDFPLAESTVLPSAGAGLYNKMGYSKRLGGCYRIANSTTRPYFLATE